MGFVEVGVFNFMDAITCCAQMASHRKSAKVVHVRFKGARLEFFATASRMAVRHQLSPVKLSDGDFSFTLTLQDVSDLVIACESHGAATVRVTEQGVEGMFTAVNRGQKHTIASLFRDVDARLDSDLDDDDRHGISRLKVQADELLAMTDALVARPASQVMYMEATSDSRLPYLFHVNDDVTYARGVIMPAK